MPILTSLSSLAWHRWGPQAYVILPIWTIYDRALTYYVSQSTYANKGGRHWSNVRWTNKDIHLYQICLSLSSRRQRRPRRPTCCQLTNWITPNCFCQCQGPMTTTRTMTALRANKQWASSCSQSSAMSISHDTTTPTLPATRKSIIHLAFFL